MKAFTFYELSYFSQTYLQRNIIFLKLYTMKKLLVIVDYQNDFVNGPLGFQDAVNLEDKIVSRILKAESEGEDIVFTKDVHDKNYLDSEEGKHLPIIHCQKGESGAELFGKLKMFESKYPTFEKPTFGSIELANYLLDKDYEQITVIGLISYICVLSNAVLCKSALPNAHIVVEKELTAADNKHAQEVGFEALKNIQIEVK